MVIYHNIRVRDNDFEFFSNNKRVEANIVQTQIQPALFWHHVFAITARIIFKIRSKNLEN